MALKVGAADVADVRLGATQVAKVMLGAEQVWPTGPWRPDRIPRSIAWWDASNGWDGAEWVDLTGNQQPLPVLAGQQAPTTTTVNGLTALEFNGQNQVLAQTLDRPVTPPATSPYSAWAVLQATSTRGVLVGHAWLTIRSRSPNWVYDARANRDTGHPCIIGQPALVVVVIESSSVGHSSVNGSTLASTGGSNAENFRQGLERAGFGANQKDGLVDKEIGAGIVCEAGLVDGPITQTDVDQLHTYCQKKWMIP